MQEPGLFLVRGGNQAPPTEFQGFNRATSSILYSDSESTVEDEAIAYFVSFFLQILDMLSQSSVALPHIFGAAFSCSYSQAR
jgi:hypothetical protein